MVNPDLLFNALLTGLFLGGFYAAVSVGVTIAFGMLDIVNIAHTAFIMLGAFVAYYLNSQFGIDPLLASLIAVPPAFYGGRLFYKFYYYAFERHGEESLQGLAFFFGILSSSKSVCCWFLAWTFALSRPAISARPSITDISRCHCVS